MKILDNYITQLIENSTPQEPAWNIEKIRAGKPNTWNYIDGCMIKALLTIYDITEDARYLNFADEFIDYFVNEDGTIKYYDPEEYNLLPNGSHSPHPLLFLRKKPLSEAGLS